MRQSYCHIVMKVVVLHTRSMMRHGIFFSHSLLENLALQNNKVSIAQCILNKERMIYNYQNAGITIYTTHFSARGT